MNRYTTPEELRCIRKQGNRYTVRVKGKYIGIFQDLEKAQRVRDREIKGVVPQGKNANLRMRGFSLRLQKAVWSSGLDETLICKRADITRTQLWNYINKQSVPSLASFAKLAVALAVSADWLLGLEG